MLVTQSPRTPLLFSSCTACELSLAPPQQGAALQLRARGSVLHTAAGHMMHSQHVMRPCLVTQRQPMGAGLLARHALPMHATIGLDAAAASTHSHTGFMLPSASAATQKQGGRLQRWALQPPIPDMQPAGVGLPAPPHLLSCHGTALLVLICCHQVMVCLAAATPTLPSQHPMHHQGCCGTRTATQTHTPWHTGTHPATTTPQPPMRATTTAMASFWLCRYRRRAFTSWALVAASSAAFSSRWWRVWA